MAQRRVVITRLRDGVQVGNVKSVEGVELQEAGDDRERRGICGQGRTERAVGVSPAGPGMHHQTAFEVDDRNDVHGEGALRILVCEYVTGGGLRRDALPDGLAREGDVMAQALVKDLAVLPGIEVWTTRDDRLADPKSIEHTVKVGEDQALTDVLRDLLPAVDGFWPIAPETGGILESLCRLATKGPCRLLASDPDTVALCASKRLCAQRLAARGLPVADTWTFGEERDSTDGYVVKPDDGVDCDRVHFLPDHQSLTAYLADARSSSDIVIQPYLSGQSVSLSLLCRHGEAWLLTYNRQIIDRRSGAFRYKGSDVGIACDHWEPYEEMAHGVAAALPGLWGYVGLDLVEAAEGPLLLEVNPRLTTSYAALSQSLGANTAELCLALLGQPISQLKRPLDPTPTTISCGHG